jgi:DNA-binding NarL/FixJ family response regulator
MPTNPIAVVLVDDHAIMRQGLRLLIEENDDIKIVGEAKTGREAIKIATQHRPDVVIMDIAMPLMNGIQATRHILKASPKTKILILSAHSDSEYVEQVIEMGASGYLLKQTSAKILAEAVRELKRGKTFFDPSVARELRDKYQKTSRGGGLVKKEDTKLTSREAELLQLIAEGHVNKQIASELEISIKTVEKHRQHLMEKLDIHDIAGLTRFAIATGSIENRGPKAIRAGAEPTRRRS